MLYQIAMFWDRRQGKTEASPVSVDATHWVEVKAPGAAKTIIFVDSAANAERLARTINEVLGNADDQEASDTLDRRQEKLALIREFRDTTQSRSTYERCVAIVGERTP